MFHFLSNHKQKVAELISTNLNFDLNYFRLFCITRFGDPLQCDKRIAEFIKIAIKAETKYAQFLYLNIIIGFIFAIIYTIAVIILNFYFHSDFGNIIFVILYVVLVFLYNFGLRRLIKRNYVKYSVPLVVSKLLNIISDLIHIGDLSFKYSSLDEEKLNKAENIIGEMKKRTESYNKVPKKLEESQSEEERLFRSKQRILSNLELAARYFENYIPILLKSKDFATDELFKHSMRQVAAALREKKIWVLTPMDDTYSQLAERLVDTLTKTVNDNWHDLERVEPSKISRPTIVRLIMNYALKALKTLFLGSLVLLLFLVFQLISPFPINNTIQSIWLIGGFLWLGITILIRFDPDVTTKFALMKDAKTLISSQEAIPKL